MELDKAVSERINGIKGEQGLDVLKKELLTLHEERIKMEAEMASKIESDKKRDEEIKAAKDKIHEVMNTNWSSKFDTSKVKEETLYRFGKYIQAYVRKDKWGLEKYGAGGRQLDPMEENQFGDGNVQKDFSPQGKVAAIGTPLYSDTTTGSLIVPIEYMAEVLLVAKQASQLMGLVREVPMGAYTKVVPVQLTAAGFTWKAAQSTIAAASAPTFTNATLTAYTGYLFIPLTEEFQEDSMVNVGAYFRDMIGQAWGYEFDYQACQGTSPFTGMLGAAGNVFTLGAGKTAFSSISFDDLDGVIAKLDSEMKRVGARWILHCTVLDILRGKKNANGDYLFQQAAGNVPATIRGYPFTSSDGMISNSSSAISTKFLIFGNPQNFLHGNRVALEIKVFDQIPDMVLYDTMAIRARVRAGFAVGVSGAFAVAKTAAA
jgi:HK97 family phage major capsid protein